jgi:hypothetical protein
MEPQYRVDYQHAWNPWYSAAVPGRMYAQEGYEMSCYTPSAIPPTCACLSIPKYTNQSIAIRALVSILLLQCRQMAILQG